MKKYLYSIVILSLFAVPSISIGYDPFGYNEGNECSSTFAPNNEQYEVRTDYYGNRIEIIGRKEYLNYKGYRIPRDMDNYDKQKVKKLIDNFENKLKRMCPICIEAPKGDCCKCKKK